MKTIIIDSNNLIHKVHNLKILFGKDKEAAMNALVEAVKSRIGKGNKVIFIFDGFGKSRSKDIIYSNEFTADDLIREKIENFKEYKKLRVISSDTNITNLARVCGFEIQKSEDFWNGINNSGSVTNGKNINQNYLYDKKEKPERMNKKEMDEFKKYFA